MLNVTPGAVSHRIKELEGEIGIWRAKADSSYFLVTRAIDQDNPRVRAFKEWFSDEVAEFAQRIEHDFGLEICLNSLHVFSAKQQRASGLFAARALCEDVLSGFDIDRYGSTGELLAVCPDFRNESPAWESRVRCGIVDAWFWNSEVTEFGA